MILHHTGYSRPGGGILAVLARLAPRLRGRCVLGAGRVPEPRLAGGLRQASLPAGSPDRLCAASLRSSFVLALGLRRRELLRGRGRVLVHGHSREGFLLALWLCLLGDSSPAVTVHALGSRRWAYRWAAWMLDGRLACLGPAMKAYYDLGDESWESCLPDCLPGGPSGAPPARRGRREGFTVGCAGALAPVKEWELAARALALLPGDIRFVHAGAVPAGEDCAVYAAGLRDQLRPEVAAGRWSWSGQVADMPAWLEGIDCLLVCGRLEAMSVAALEAAAAGIPVVAPRGSGARDIIASFGNGLLFKDGDAADLAAVLVQARRQLPCGASLPAPFRFSAATVAEAYGRLWDEEPVL